MRKFIRHFSLLVIILLFFSNGPALASAETFTSKVEIHYINVGQGESELIEADGKNVLIDAGNDDKVYSYLKSHGITKLDYVIVTYPNENYIGSMATIIKNFEIGTFYAPNVSTATQAYNNMVNALNAKNLKITVPDVGKRIIIGNATLTFLSPSTKTYDKASDNSVVCKLKCGDTSFMFMGDAEDMSGNDILANQLDLKADVLKIGIRGSLSSKTQEFLNRINPKSAVIKSGVDKNSNQSIQKDSDMLNKKGVEIFRTDLNGNIIAKSDGTNIRFYTELV